MLRVLTLSTLYPNALKPNFGVFVEGQTSRLAARPGVSLRVVNPIATAPFPLDRHPRYHALRAVPEDETWHGVRVARPRFATIPGAGGAMNPMLVARAARPVMRRWRDEGFAPDVIDAEFFYPDGPAAATLATEFGVPYSVKARGADIHYWAERRGCGRQIVRAGCGADGLLAVSASLRRDMIALGMPPERIAVHYTGVDLERFAPLDREQAKAALGVAGPLVVSVGALIPRKGHDLLIRAMAMLPGATLLVAGDGPERGRLAGLITTLGLDGRVRLLGGVPHGALPAILAAADVMALASQSEGLANAWVEALACGTPVVTPDVDGAAEAIDRPAAGRLIVERTPAALAAAIGAILADPPAQAEVRAGAERFAWSRNTEQLYGHLAGLASAFRSTRTR